MKSPEEVLEHATAVGGDDREAALVELRARGVATANAILDRAERTERILPPWIRELLLETADASLLPRALAALATMPSALGYTAYPLLGLLGDKAATRPLLDHFLDDELGPSFRVMAAQALAAIRDPAARDPIKARLARWFVGPERSVEALVAAAPEQTARSFLPPLAGAVALAALGDHDFDQGVYALVQTPKAKLGKLPEIKSVYPEMAMTLGHLVSPGLIAACRAVLALLAEESKEVFAATLARIGTRGAIELLVGLTKSRRQATAEVATGWLHVVADAPLVEEDFGESAARWWATHGKKLAPDVVYLGGKPWTVASFFAEIEDRASDTAGEEVESVTGKNLLREQRARKADRATTLRALAKELAPRLPAGKLHRYGHTFDPPAF